MKRWTKHGGSPATGLAIGTAALTAASLLCPGVAAAADRADSSVPVGPDTQLEIHTTADCVAGTNTCHFTTGANLMTPQGPVGFPGDLWARQTVTVRSSNRDVWQETSYSAPAGTPRETKGANHDNALSEMYRSLSSNEISVTYFGGGPIERFTVEGDSAPIDWASGRPDTEATFIVCSNIHVVYGGHDLMSPTACSQTGF
ncbi:hypothetical protein [Mycolicibacterium palauense]|uniref:hypothetical protein n=1 Tax=Mycolicibacterium palauense TaxID=2034511 RepID=UPI000BFEC09E|nr:hypothetical protein [Mycolicibacterium palauense]